MEDKHVKLSIPTAMLVIQGLAVFERHVRLEKEALMTSVDLVVNPPTPPKPVKSGKPHVSIRTEANGADAAIVAESVARAITRKKPVYTTAKRAEMASRVRALWADPDYRGRVLRKRAQTLKRKKAAAQV